MKKILYLLLNLVVIFLLFMFGNGMTTTPGSSSGNGNPAILLFIPLGILFIVLVVQWFNTIKKKRAHVNATLITILVLVCHFIAGFYYQVASYRKYRDYLAEVYAEQFGSVDWEYINSITSGLDIHINNQYFNWNTYFLFISFSIFIALTINGIKQITEKQT